MYVRMHISLNLYLYITCAHTTLTILLSSSSYTMCTDECIVFDKTEKFVHLYESSATMNTHMRFIVYSNKRLSHMNIRV